jgi:RNA polymerase sigma factor (sigma-70 family)
MFIRFRPKQMIRSLSDLSDDELILRYRETGEPDIVALLFQRYTHLVYGVCLKYLDDKDDAKDAVMEIFEGLYEDIPRFTIRNFKSWLHSVTRNHCLMKIRKLRTFRMESGEISQISDRNFMEFPEELHQENELNGYTLDELETAISKLKLPQRKCIELVYLKEKSYLEVCEITGYAMNEVKSHVQNGKRNLRLILESKNAEKKH